MPPLEGRVGLSHRRGAWTYGVATSMAAAQHRLGEFEQPTAAYATLDAHLGWTVPHGDHLHAVLVRGDNLTNAEYRNHISRIKTIQPEPGRGVSLLYRVHFY
jgi:iron complex outermembrane receptor protein